MYVTDDSFPPALVMRRRMGSHADRNVTVPTAVPASSGVYKKCGLGLTMTTSLLGPAHLRNALSPPQPLPKITTLSFFPSCLVAEEEGGK
mmetsp:Transcript_14623/g.32252  ORF Transcript_14623/g.32252 Transcript_14623/m.32252 type:complete len:90 (-) Transcript_14623:156-425(-)